MSLRLSAYLAPSALKEHVNRRGAENAETTQSCYLELTEIVCVAVLPATS